MLTKAVIPVAGLGTRFLPLTKAVPKEMLPILDRPCLEYIVAEAVEADLTDIIFITARGKESILNYFDRSPALEQSLEATGKQGMLREIRRVAALARMVSVRQGEPLGLGHAILTAAPVTGKEDFAVLLGDDIVDAPRPAIGQLLEVYRRYGGAGVALMEVAQEDTRRYGIVDGEVLSPGVLRVRRMVEKPDPAFAPSRQAIVGRYILPARIHALLAETPRGAGGEIQLTDALALLAAQGEVWGHTFEGTWLDTGNPLGLLRATLHLGLKRPDMAEAIQALIQQYAR